MSGNCEHCGRWAILAARVRSDLLDLVCCHPCSVLAAKLSFACGEDVEGALKVEPFKIELESVVEIRPAYTQFFKQLSRN
jgi:hypothetical protein